MSDAYARFAKPVLMRMDAENAHKMTLALLKTGIGPRYAANHPALATKVLGISFPNPLGLAAGFDKNAEAVAGVFRLGFGFVEAGTVTPRPQTGNPRPRVFRDPGSESVINRMGFPGLGLDVFEANLRRFKAANPGRIVGANIGINKDAADPGAAYLESLARLGTLADYIAVNVSSPNTVGLRSLQAKEELDKLLSRLMAGKGGARILLKVAPDLSEEERGDIAALVRAHGLHGLIVSNTTVSRPPALAAALREEKGGLSGRLLTGMATEGIRSFRRLLPREIPIIGVGGVSSAAEAYDKIKAGASLVQVYSGLVFRGPGLVREILEGLPPLLARDGFSHVAEAVGTG